MPKPLLDDDMISLTLRRSQWKSLFKTWTAHSSPGNPTELTLRKLLDPYSGPIDIKDVDFEEHLGGTGINTRLYRILPDNGVLTLEDCAKLSDANLLRIPDLGRNALRRIRLACETHGIPRK